MIISTISIVLTNNAPTATLNVAPLFTFFYEILNLITWIGN